MEDIVGNMEKQVNKLFLSSHKTRHVLEGKCPSFVPVEENLSMGVRLLKLCVKPYGHTGAHEANNVVNFRYVSSTADSDYRYYLAHADELMRKYPQRFVLIKDQQVHGDFASLEEAHRKALELFGNVDVFIEEMTKKKPTNVFFPD